MAAKNKNSKKQSNNIAITIFTSVLSLALVAIIFFGIFVLIYDPLGDNNGDIKASVPQDMNMNINPINALNQNNNNNIGLNANIGTSNVGGFGISIGKK